MQRQAMIDAMDTAQAMEALYRADPRGFKRVFPEVYAQHPEAMILQVWQQRLFYPPAQGRETPRTWASFFWMLGLSLLMTLLLRISDYTDINAQWFYERFAFSIVLSAIFAYYLPARIAWRKPLLMLSAIQGFFYAYLYFLPSAQASDTAMLAFLHMPFLIWSSIAMLYMGDNWRSVEQRMAFIRLSGEVVVYASLILVGGMILTMLTLGLFNILGLDIAQWYMKNVVLWGVLSAPLVAVYLFDRVIENHSSLTHILARIFSPLILLTVLAYLAAMLFSQGSPFTDRETLLTFNLLLLLVLAVVVFSLSGQQREEVSTLYSVINSVLILTTLSVDAIALAAIVYRLMSFGITPNRIAVLGMNLIVFVNLLGIMRHYYGFLRRGDGLGGLEQWLGNYLPVYSLWTLLVVFLLPPLFGFN